MGLQTTMTVEELIATCEENIRGEWGTCTSTACFFINEIGVHAAACGDRTAQKYLIGLLSHSHDGFRYIALLYLLQIENLELGDKVILDSFKEKRANISLVQKAHRAIREHHLSKSLN